MPERETPKPFSNQDHTPFRKNIELAPAIPYEEMTHTHIMESGDYPNVIFRISRRERPDDPEWNTGDIQEELQLGEKLFTELSSKYGIQVVHHHFVIGGAPDDPTTPTVYTIADKIIGNKLGDTLTKQDVAQQPTNPTQLFDRLIQYHADVMAMGGKYLSDVTRGVDQYMFGHTAKDPRDQIYLTDIDPIIRSYTPEEPTEKQARDMDRSLDELARMILTTERLSGLDMRSTKLDFIERIDLSKVKIDSQFRQHIDELSQSLAEKP